MRKNEEHLFQAERRDKQDFDQFFADTLGLSLQPVRELTTEVLNDLDTAMFGVGWWSAYPKLGDKRRIVISDCLCLAALSISDNMVEAKLHLFEYLEWWDLERKQMRGAVKLDALGYPKMRELRRAHEGLAQRMIHLHSAGFFRAISSSFDCLGAAIVGVVGLPQRILRSDLGKARSALQSASASGSPGEQAQAQFAGKFEQIVHSAGPKGWLEWASNLRNMLAHRGRRMQFGHLHVERSKVKDRHGRPHAVTPVERALPTEPGWCEIDAALQPSPLMLGEDASETMEGILASTVYLIETSAVALLELWRARRASPSLIEQPASQWPSVNTPCGSGFQGYAPKAQGVGDEIVMSPTDLHRLRAAALTSDNRHRWDQFT